METDKEKNARFDLDEAALFFPQISRSREA